MTPLSAAAQTILSAKAVRERSVRMMRLCEQDQLAHWQVHRGRLPELVDYVVDTARMRYPGNDIPFHARWRHFCADGNDRWATLVREAKWPSISATGRAAFDLVIISVLLDAGAGVEWRYHDTAGGVLSRSEGLAVASFEMFAAGAFSARPNAPFRVDACRLQSMTSAELARFFQVSSSNPLLGLDGRVALLTALGGIISARPEVFAIGDEPRPGGLFDYLIGQASARQLPAEHIVVALLEELGLLWPSRLTLDGTRLGDCWHHPLIIYDDATTGLVPFHKLSQWLAYSLIEPLQWAGLEIVQIDGLTGLPEYRNGGLFIDFGVLTLKNSSEAAVVHRPDSALVVEWRALTVALLDEVATMVRAKFGLDAVSLPLAKILEGGTWAAGRRIAAERRWNGAPPLQIASDGTLF